jgi:excisionase family DNA binding protein
MQRKLAFVPPEAFMKSKNLSSRVHSPGPPRTQFPTFLTGPEVCRILQISASTFTRMMQRGELPGIKVTDRLWRVQQKDLEAYIAERSPTAA